jgi:hypothetical protein
MHRENTEDRTGPLRNGNPRGNPNLAPRCGAKTRAGCPCQAPAMANGRCRMHGGASTGPRTEAGRARIRAANTKHGGYSAESQAALRRTSAFIAETRALLALHRAGAHKLDANAPQRLHVVDAVAPRGRKARAGGESLCNVRNAAP